MGQGGGTRAPGDGEAVAGDAIFSCPAPTHTLYKGEYDANFLVFVEGTSATHTRLVVNKDATIQTSSHMVNLGLYPERKN